MQSKYKPKLKKMQIIYVLDKKNNLTWPKCKAQLNKKK